jgi:metallo-beta-lactamase family protein
LRFSRSTEDSMAINRINAGAIIIAGSGMCTGGRIRHHLKHNLWRRNAHVLIVGFQAAGTTGRKLVDGAKSIRLAGEEIVVNAQIHTLGGFSAHASQTQLLEWVQGFNAPRPDIYLIHGEGDAKQMLKQKLQTQGWRVNIPGYATSIEI